MGLDDKQKFELFAKYFDVSNRRAAMKDFARLNVYFADSNVLKTEESEEYSQSQLLSDIGGQSALWVGISVLTLAEVLELLIGMVKYVKKSVKQDNEYSNGSDLGIAEEGINGHC